LARERILTPTAYFISIGKAVSNKNITDPYRYLTKKNCYLLWMKYETKKVRKKGQKRCNRYGYIASFKNCPLEHSAKVTTDLITLCHSEGVKRLKNLSIFAGFFTFAQNDIRENTN